MALLGMQEVGIAFGGPPILHGARFSIERGERVCLLGRNGAGKSTIMRLLDGTLTPDSGEVVRQTEVTVARLEQEVPEDVSGSTFDVVAAGLGPSGLLLAHYHEASHRVGRDATDAALRELDRLHHALDTANGWEMQTRVDTVLQHLALDPDVPFHLLSGGRKRQTLLARALVREPDVLLLDEPASALDPIATGAIEDLMHNLKGRFTIVIVTHNMQQAARVADRTAFFSLETRGEKPVGSLIEFDDTEKIFGDPRDPRTRDYVTGRFG